jgi:capsular polysaccharide biosynthesis protein
MDRTTIASIFAAVGRHWWLALLVLATTLAADVYYTQTRQVTYLARATLIVSPSPNTERGSLVYSVDSLGRGRILGTYAEVLGSEVLHRAVVDRLGYSADVLNRFITFRSSVVADTAIIQVTAESFDPAISADAANLVGELGIERMAALYPVYNLSFLTMAVPPVTPYRPDPVRNYLLGVLFGLILAVVLAYLFDVALHLRRRGVITPSEPDRQPGPAQSLGAQSVRGT